MSSTAEKEKAYRRLLEQWTRAVLDDRQMLATCFFRLGDSTRALGYVDYESWEMDRCRTAAYHVLVSMRNVLRYATALADLTKDPEIQGHLKTFGSRLGQVKDLRDFLEHLDAYIVGRGRHQSRYTDPGPFGGLAIDARGFHHLRFAFASTDISMEDATGMAVFLGQKILGKGYTVPYPISVA